MALDLFAPPRSPQLPTPSRKLDERALIAGFGDGYEQTAAQGLNAHYEKSVSLIWKAIADADADQIEAFWDTHGTTRAWRYTLPGRATEKQWKFVDFQRDAVTGALDAISVTIRQVFDLS